MDKINVIIVTTKLRSCYKMDELQKELFTLLFYWSVFSGIAIFIGLKREEKKAKERKRKQRKLERKQEQVNRICDKLGL